MRLINCSAAFLAIAIAACLPAGAMEPIAVLSCASRTEVEADLACLGSTIKNADFVAAVGLALAKVTGVKSLDGIDPSRRWGVVIQTDGLAVVPMVIVPVTDLNALLLSLEPLIGPAEGPAEGLIKIGRGQLTGYIKEQGGWAYLGQTPDALVDLPDPSVVLAAPEASDVVASLHVRRIPEALRTFAIDYLRSMPRDVSSPDLGLTLLERGFNDVNNLSVSWSLDHETKRVLWEVTMRPVAGSSLATAVALLAPTHATLTGPPARSPLGVSLNWRLEQEAADSLADTIRARQWPFLMILPTANAADSASDKLHSAMAETLATSVGNQSALACSFWVLGGEAPPWTFGASLDLGNPKDAGRMLEQFSTIAGVDSPKEGPLTFPLPAAQQASLARLFGAKACLQVAAAGNSLVLTVGPNAAAQFPTRAQYDHLPPLIATCRLGDWINVVAQETRDPQKLALSLIALNLRAGGDRVNLTAKGGETLRVRLDAREGVLRAAALAISLATIDVLARPDGK